MSFGVAATAPGESFEYTDVFERADMVLYEAKNNGRDRVIVDGMAPERELVAA
jgi:PleD family two-component response regulator